MTKFAIALATGAVFLFPVMGNTAETPVTIPQKPDTTAEVQTPREEEDTAVQAKRGTVTGKLVEINSEERTLIVNDAEKGLQKLHIGEGTKFQRDGKEATWTDLKIGAKVKASFSEEKATARAQSIELLE